MGIRFSASSRRSAAARHRRCLDQPRPAGARFAPGHLKYPTWHCLLAANTGCPTAPALVSWPSWTFWYSAARYSSPGLSRRWPSRTAIPSPPSTAASPASRCTAYTRCWATGRIPSRCGSWPARSFDLVFDTGYFPDRVRASAELLEPNVGHYAFTSSISVFPGWPESADYRSLRAAMTATRTRSASKLPDGLPEGGGYGWRKVGAERAVLRSFGEHRAAILRAGCIVGPHDSVGRLPWWLDRISSRRSDRWYPGRPTRAAADRRPRHRRVRAEVAGRHLRGDRAGAPDQLPAAVRRARTVTGSDAEFHWLDDQVLLDAGVRGVDGAAVVGQLPPAHPGCGSTTAARRKRPGWPAGR